MDRRVFLLIASTALVGCQAPTPNFDPFAISGQTRIPPPPTGTVGRPGSYLPPLPPPLPPVNSNTSFRSQDRPGSAGLFAGTELNALASRGGGTAHGSLERQGELSWRDPADQEVPGSRADTGLARPQPLTRLGNVQPLARHEVDVSPAVTRPPRIRGFVNAGVRDLRIPAELADDNASSAGTVRTASGRWEPTATPVR